MKNKIISICMSSVIALTLLTPTSFAEFQNNLNPSSSSETEYLETDDSESDNPDIGSLTDTDFESDSDSSTSSETKYSETNDLENDNSEIGSSADDDFETNCLHSILYTFDDVNKKQNTIKNNDIVSSFITILYESIFVLFLSLL